MQSSWIKEKRERTNLRQKGCRNISRIGESFRARQSHCNPRLTHVPRKGVKGRLLQWTQDFPIYAKVRINGQYSQTKHFGNSTTQGNILGPFLFNTQVENLVTRPLPGGSQVLCYEDDIAIVTTGREHHTNAQTALNTLSKSCHSLGLKITLHETKTMYFGSTLPVPPLYNQEIPL